MDKMSVLFPSLLEVDRYLYKHSLFNITVIIPSFRPLSRQIGSYTENEITLDNWEKVSGPSRGRQVAIKLKRKVSKHSLSSFRSLARQISNYTERIAKSKANNHQFSPPPEVDRELYRIKIKLFKQKEGFPAPLEVYRWLYSSMVRFCYGRRCLVSVPYRGRQVAISSILFKNVSSGKAFPAPREVDRQLYVTFHHFDRDSGTWMFPAPREVDRQLYILIVQHIQSRKLLCFRPLARQIGSYTANGEREADFIRLFPAPLEVDR